MHSVLLSDDHPLLLRGLQDILGAAPDFQIIGATTSGAKALSLVRNRKPDIALLDVAMPDVGGLDRSEEHTSELQSLMRISYAVFCLKKKKNDMKILE